MVDFVEARQPRSSWRSRSRIKNCQRLTYMKALGFFRSAGFAAEMGASHGRLFSGSSGRTQLRGI
jgi:hypothetical protein